MKKLIVPLVIVFSLTACGEQQTSMTENEINAKVDSLVGEKQAEIMDEAMADLDNRKSIEVKAKADSIVEATLNAK